MSRRWVGTRSLSLRACGDDRVIWGNGPGYSVVIDTSDSLTGVQWVFAVRRRRWPSVQCCRSQRPGKDRRSLPSLAWRPSALPP
ncbi:MAG: hypothetical protein CM15mP125_1160 [Gammaproteobacteria bacterium]|nr:MAG: hypothetical protein CM15mP125_1160 [Gammaproteobacteria bacterium]